MVLSKRVTELAVSPTRKFNKLAAEMEQKGKTIHRLSIGQPDLQAPELYFEAMANFTGRTMKYANAKGRENLLKAQSDYYKRLNLDYDEKDIFVTNGATEGLSLSMTALCDPGDGVSMIEPFYTNYSLIGNILGLTIEPIPSSIEDNYLVPTVEEMEKHISEKTKVILFSNPSNPTGRVYSKEELQRIVDLALKHDLFIISDEVYRELVLNDMPYKSMGDFPEIRDRLILLDSASKKFAACGARIGTLATKNEEVAQGIMKQCQLRLGVSTMEQEAIAKLTSELSCDYYTEMVEIYRKRRDVLEEELDRLAIPHSNAEGAFYTLAKLPVKNTEKFQNWLLAEFDDNGETILFTPAQGFYATPGSGMDEVRISYCVNEDVLRRTFEILEKALCIYTD